MEQATNDKKRHKRNISLEEKLALLEAKEKRAKAAEAKCKTKIAKLRSAMLLQKRESFDKVLSANGIQTESQLETVMELYRQLSSWGIHTKSELNDMLAAAAQSDSSYMENQFEPKSRNEQTADD